MNGTQAAGWIRSDEPGLYRIAMDGRQVSHLWHLTTSGSWTEVR